MHYEKLVRAHQLFYEIEPRAHFYDEYMSRRNEKDWHSGDLSLSEVDKLFSFIREWEYHFQGNRELFKKIYDGNYLSIKSLMNETIQDADFYDQALRMKIRYIFDRLADCDGKRRYESTDASTILHTILPKLFVLWDNNIKEKVKVQTRGANYSGVFLLKIQRELNEAIKTCMYENQLDRVGAVSFIEEKGGKKTLAKLADEYNYMKFAKNHPDIT
jgi:hypothetical protein